MKTTILATNDLDEKPVNLVIETVDDNDNYVILKFGEDKEYEVTLVELIAALAGVSKLRDFYKQQEKEE